MQARQDPVRLLLCVTSWQNWCCFAARELANLGHSLNWIVLRVRELPFGGFAERGLRVPAS